VEGRCRRIRLAAAETDNTPGRPVQEDTPVSVYLLYIDKEWYLYGPLSTFHEHHAAEKTTIATSEQQNPSGVFFSDATKTSVASSNLCYSLNML